MKDPRAVRASDGDVRIHAAIKFDPATNDVVYDDVFTWRAEPNRSFILVNDTLGLKQVQIFFVDGVSLALKIRAVLSTDSRAFVPIESQPAQSIINHLNRFLT